MTMAGLLLQVQQSPSFHYLLRDALEPIAGPLTLFVIIGLIVFAIRRRIRYNRMLYNAINRPTTIIYQQLPTPEVPVPPEDYTSLTKEDFYNLPWEVRETMYKNRIRQLNDTIQGLKTRLKDAGLPTD
jgi:hypothetical protein